MWPFRKNRPADRALSLTPAAIQMASEKWLFMANSRVFTADMTLTDRIKMFSNPFERWLYIDKPIFREIPGAAMMIVARGIEASGTHSRTEIERAMGFKIPV